jgi:methionyl-tRNA formyltransferase
MGLRLIFMGTSGFAVPSLKALLESPNEIILVVTQPDRPAGRGRRLKPTPVKEAACRVGLEGKVICPHSVKDHEFVEFVRRNRPDALVVAAFGQILPPQLLEIPPLGAVNVHPSLLPKYRGAAPIQRAILNGEEITGVTLIQMDEGMDSGPVLMQRKTSIREEEDAEELSKRLAQMGAGMLLEALELMEQGSITPKPQREEEATYAPPLRKEEGEIRWERAALEIQRQVRAMVPWPGAYTFWRGRRLKVHRARAGLCDGEGGEPGMVLEMRDGALRVATGRCCVYLLEVQPENRPRMSSEAFFQGHRDILGERLGRL